ncbi:MAG: OB-fold nucleic acid binding domain-containing protein, partial [Caldilineaceae bacterium]|nr:OB-fold nucleic acid binding domain-containing protein [Caldilineaceae bacterium]
LCSVTRTRRGAPGARVISIVRVAGRVVRRQRPLAKAVFMTLEDEWGLIPVAVWPDVWQAYKQVLKQPLVVIQGEVSRIDNTMNIATHRAWGLKLPGRRFENVTRPDWR